jgi:hypothetical protein
MRGTATAFSSEVDTGSREENAINKDLETFSDSIGTCSNGSFAAANLACLLALIGVRGATALSGDIAQDFMHGRKLGEQPWTPRGKSLRARPHNEVYMTLDISEYSCP